MPRHPQSSPINHSVFLVILALVATVGWGLLFVWRHSASEFEDQLQDQITSLHQRQIELLHERTQREAAVGALETLKSDTAALHKELEGLKLTREQVQADLTRLRAEQDMAGAPSGRSQAAGGGAAPLPKSKWEPDHAIIIAAQQALTKLGYGPLVFDGIVGPSTRQAIEDFQDDHGMQVTSKLDSATLRQLTASNKTGILE